MKRFENSTRAGGGIDRRIGPTTKPTKRSIAVQSPPPTTWQKTSPQRASRAIATTTPMSTSATIGSALRGTISNGWATGASAATALIAETLCQSEALFEHLGLAQRLPVSCQLANEPCRPRAPPWSTNVGGRPGGDDRLLDRSSVREQLRAQEILRRDCEPAWRGAREGRAHARERGL